jgi:hypothetical protein
VVSYGKRIDSVFRLGTATFHDVVGISKVGLDAIDCEAGIQVISVNMIFNSCNVTKDISTLPVFALECDVLWVKPSQDAHYCTLP